jgi:hypothetical protein
VLGIDYRDMNSQKEPTCFGCLRNFASKSDWYFNWLVWRLDGKVIAMHWYQWRVCRIKIMLLYLWISTNHSLWRCCDIEIIYVSIASSQDWREYFRSQFILHPEQLHASLFPSCNQMQPTPIPGFVRRFHIQ